MNKEALLKVVDFYGRNRLNKRLKIFYHTLLLTVLNRKTCLVLAFNNILKWA